MGGISAIHRDRVVAIPIDDLVSAARVAPGRARLTGGTCGVIYELSKPEEPIDTEELAARAADALEDYRRAPWTGIADRIRIAKLRLARRLLGRIVRFEDARRARQLRRPPGPELPRPQRCN